MSDSTSVGAIIVTHNPDLRRLERSLSSLVGQTSRVVIVDNGSENRGALQVLSERYTTVDVFSLGENRGIATGFNVGVKELASGGTLPPWVLTADQDSVLDSAAIALLFDALGKLDESTSCRCGIVAAAWQHHVPSTRWLPRRAARVSDLGSVGEFQKRLFVISSGNLVRREVLEDVAYEDELFIDNVDHAFCAKARRRGWLVVESNAILMEHRLGVGFEHRGRPRNYENAQRLYYITRNSTYMLLRRDLPPSVYLASLLWWFRSFFFKQGASSAFAGILILIVGVFDGMFCRLGRREYAFIARELRRPAAR